jgi:hypothetical protein
MMLAYRNLELFVPLRNLLTVHKDLMGYKTLWFNVEWREATMDFCESFGNSGVTRLLLE